MCLAFLNLSWDSRHAHNATLPLAMPLTQLQP